MAEQTCSIKVGKKAFLLAFCIIPALMVGLGMRLLPLTFGFSAAVTNTFTIGVAQTIAELPLFVGGFGPF